LFARHGYGAVGTEAILQAAGVSRGAMYHQFTGKAELFEAVFESVEASVMDRLGERLDEAERSPDHAPDAVELLELGVEAWLDVCRDQEVQQIVLLDGPAVLGWERWREISIAHAGALMEAALAGAMAAGHMRAQPVRPLAVVMIAALDEAALYVARADDPESARAEMMAALGSLVAGLVSAEADRLDEGSP
jgi:AcrR family transcriptional regulator